MAGQIPRHFIDDLLARVDIVEVIDQRVKLKRSGSNHTACCPFHSEKTPSFTVSQSKQFYHCFGCGAHGSALGFLMEYDNLHFVDAVETLAESVGLEVPYESSQGADKREQNKSLYSLMEACAAFYARQLKSNESAITYLKARGLSGEIAKRFMIGYAPAGWNNLSQAFPEQDMHLLKVGMLTRKDSGTTYDRFRERIMFPIRDRRGRVIAFGGRVINDSEPKYLNSPETPLFHKGMELYGLFEARKAMQQQGAAIVVEGYMDVVALAQHEINNCVATLGTATNSRHSETLFRAVPEIVFCFDGDNAGRDAAWRALQATLPNLRDGRDAYFLFLPQGEDPDSVVKQQGKDGFEALLKNKLSIIDFLFQHLSQDTDLEQIGVRARLVEQATPLLQSIPLGVYRKLAERQLEDLIGMSLQTLPASQSSTHRNRAPTNLPSPAPSSDKQNSPPRGLTTMRRAVLLVLNFPALTQSLDADHYDFDADLPGARLLLKLISLVDHNPEISSGALIEHFRDEPEWHIIDKLSTTPYYPDSRELSQELAQTEYAHCIAQLNRNSKPREAHKLPHSARTGLLSIRKNRDT